LAGNLPARNRSVQAWRKPDLAAVSLNDKGTSLVARGIGRGRAHLFRKRKKNRHFGGKLDNEQWAV
jgi:hypothetical protein